VNNVWWNAITASACNVNGIKNEVGSNFFEGVSIEFAGASPIVDSSITSSYNNFWIEDNNVGSLVFTGGSVKWGYGVLGANVTITVDDSTEFVCDGFNGSQTLGIMKEYPNDGIQFPRGQMAGPYASTANGTRYAFDGGRAATVIGEYGYGLNFTTNAAGAAFITWPYTGSAADLQSDWSAVIAHDTTSFATSGNTTLFAMGPAINDEYIRLAEVGGGINAYIIVPSLTTNHVLNATWWRTSNVAQVTTSVPHNFTTGQNVIVRGLFGTTTATGITATPGTTTFSFASVGADGSGSFAASQYSYRRVAVIYSDMPYTSSQGSGLHWLGMAYDASDKLLLVTNGRVTSEYYVDFSNADKTALAVRNYGANGTGTYTTTVPYYGFWNRALTLGEMLTVMNEQQHRQGDVLPLVPNLVFDAGYTPTLSGASQVGLYSALDGSSKAQLYTVNSDGYVNQLSGNVGVGTNAPTAQLVVVSQNTEPAIVLENDFFSAGIQTNIVGNVRGAGAVDLQYGRNTATMVASGRSSFIGGGTNNTASGIASAAVGGDRNKSSGYYSFAAGANNTASGDGTVAFGNGSSASGSYSMATGVQSLSTLYGQYSRASGYFTSAGDAQMSILNARALMTNATSTVKNLYLEGASGKLVIPASSTWGMRVEIVGRANTGESGYYVINALVERDAANDATIVGQTAAPVMWEDDAAWDAILVQDDAAGAITITVTGNNETTIRWVATVYLTQVRG
jgi:hypothetical protein